MTEQIRIIRHIFCALLLLVAVSLSACKERAEVLYETSSAVQESGETGESPENQETNPETESQKLCVFVCGAVVSPGVYELPVGSRVNDAVEAAGGMTEKASATYLNLAEYVSDGQKVEVPTLEEARELEEARARQEAGLVNLNTATEAQLMTLSGIGEAKARAIIAYREEHGGFSSVEELMEIAGIKEGVYRKIQGQITV